MTKRERQRARRRAERHMDAAFAALEEGREELALRESRRAVDLGGVNPKLWLEHGRVLRRCGQDGEAEAAFRQALTRAPTFAAAFAELAELQWSRGKRPAAVRLLARAAELEATDERTTRLAAWRAVTAPDEPAGAEPGPEPAAVPGGRTEGHRWDEIATALAAKGCARLPALLSATECRQLRARAGGEPAEYDLVREDEGARARWLPLAGPLPEPLEDLAVELYARAAGIVNGWEARLGRGRRFAPTLEAARRAGLPGAASPLDRPALVRYPLRGFEAPRALALPRDALPVWLRVDLGPGSSAEGGGAFRLVDLRPGRKEHATEVATAAGDGVLFCARERLETVGGALGLQRVGPAVGETAVDGRCALVLPPDVR